MINIDFNEFFDDHIIFGWHKRKRILIGSDPEHPLEIIEARFDYVGNLPGLPWHKCCRYTSELILQSIKIRSAGIAPEDC